MKFIVIIHHLGNLRIPAKLWRFRRNSVVKFNPGALLEHHTCVGNLGYLNHTAGHLGPCCTVILLLTCWSLVQRFVNTVSKIDEPSGAITLFGLHLLVYEPKGMNMSRKVTQTGQGDIDEQITATPSDHGCSSRREYDSNEDKDNV